jgi:hypothetical protein
LAIEVVVCKEGGFGEYTTECLKRLNVLVVESELVVSPCELSEGCGDLTIVSYKPPVEVTEAKEGLDPFYRTRVVLVFDHLNLVQINLDSISANNKAKVFGPFHSELIFLDIGLETYFV